MIGCECHHNEQNVLSRSGQPGCQGPPVWDKRQNCVLRLHLLQPTFYCLPMHQHPSAQHLCPLCKPLPPICDQGFAQFAKNVCICLIKRKVFFSALLHKYLCTSMLLCNVNATSMSMTGPGLLSNMDWAGKSQKAKSSHKRQKHCW